MCVSFPDLSQVTESQIWLDLSEANPNVTLDQSLYTIRKCRSGKRSYDLRFLVKKQVCISKTALEACHQAEAIVIATEWKEFKEIDWKTVYSHMNKPAFLFDGRLLVDAEKLKEIGFKVGVSKRDTIDQHW